MNRWKKVSDAGYACSCAMCDETVEVFHEKTLPEPREGPVVAYVVRLCADCYQERPSDEHLRSEQRPG